MLKPICQHLLRRQLQFYMFGCDSMVQMIDFVVTFFVLMIITIQFFDGTRFLLINKRYRSEIITIESELFPKILRLNSTAHTSDRPKWKHLWFTGRATDTHFMLLYYWLHESLSCFFNNSLILSNDLTVLLSAKYTLNTIWIRNEPCVSM